MVLRYILHAWYSKIDNCIPPTKLNKLTPYEISSKARQALSFLFFCAPMHLCTHAWLELAWTADELISYCTSLFSFVSGIVNINLVVVALIGC